MSRVISTERVKGGQLTTSNDTHHSIHNDKWCTGHHSVQIDSEVQTGSSRYCNSCSEANLALSSVVNGLVGGRSATEENGFGAEVRWCREFASGAICCHSETTSDGTRLLVLSRLQEREFHRENSVSECDNWPPFSAAAIDAAQCRRRASIGAFAIFCCLIIFAF